MHIAVLLLLSGAWAANVSEHCGRYKTDVSQEMKLWADTATAVADGTEIPLQKKLQLQLKDQKQVQYQITPQKNFAKDKTAFGGIFTFKAEKSGHYQMAFGKRAWLDIVDVDAAKIVKSSGSDMQTKCDKLIKVVSYNLEAGKRYLIQINGSPEASLDGTLITK